MAQANRWVDFKKAQTNAKLDGAKIPKFLRNQIISGKVSTKKAVSSLSKIVKFKDAVDKANKDGKDVPKSLIKGVNSGKTSVKSANKQLNRWIEFKDAAKKAGVDSKDIPKKMRAGILSGKTSIKSAVKQLSNQTKNNKESKANGKSAGKSYSDGYAEGIKSGKNKVYKAGKDVGKAAHKGAKDGTHSKSPSKDGIKLGIDYDTGVAIGLEKGSSLVSMAGVRLGASLNKGAKKGIKFATGSMMKSLKSAIKNGISSGNATSAGEAAIKAFDKGIDKQVKSTKKSVKKKIDSLVKDSIHDHSKKKKSSIKSAGSKMMAAFNSGIAKEANKAKTAAQNVINNITSKFQAAYDELVSKRSSLRDSLNSTDLFVTDPHGDNYLADLSGYNSKLSKLGANLNKIKSKGLNKNLLDEIAQMDTETALKFTDQLLGLSPAELKAWNAEYNKKEQLASSISNNYYSNRINELKTQYSNQVTKELNNLNTKLNKIGKNAVDGITKGLKDKKKKAKLKGAAAALGKDIIKAIKKELKISSPSRVMTKLAGFIPEGVKVGIKDKTSVAVGAMNSMVNKMISAGARMNASLGLSSGNVASAMGVNRPAWATGYGNSTTSNSSVTNINYQQNINAPKQPSALEIYRNTQNSLNQLKRKLK